MSDEIDSHIYLMLC